MGKKQRKEMTFLEKMAKLKHAGFENSKMIGQQSIDLSSIEELDERIKQILGILSVTNRNPLNMLFFVMYDIESDKVRYQIVKYLLKKGCHRIQRSIFLADLDTRDYEEIRSSLAEVQSCYDNHDSIMIVPVSTELLRSMKVIGKTIDVDIIIKSKNTLFF
ncbi:CRISPR-associated endonuclease Cas2 [uncultured Bacteroides sp.]|jgi:CRISPR-associated endoribonuclease cas2|uniref:CRISPR-associated endonuclease Cas2 n=1 Tax=uncultured Bacteroides sp. TaxID=162156 RepID=UPI002613BF26|nr:CRISPR-associated endonuclease Cas2 [uncultured Bacteroides sp.]